MSEEERITILAIKGAISELAPEHEERCNELAEHIRRMIASAGSPVGELAIALVGAEVQAAMQEYRKTHPTPVEAEGKRGGD